MRHCHSERRGTIGWCHARLAPKFETPMNRYPEGHNAGSTSVTKVARIRRTSIINLRMFVIYGPVVFRRGSSYRGMSWYHVAITWQVSQ